MLSARPALSTADRALQLDQQLCFALYSASLAMTKLYKNTLQPLGLTYPQYLVLLVLWQHGEVSVGDLGERLCLDSGTLTPLLKRMESSGWLSRQRAAADERRVLVGLTEAGLALRSQARAVPRQIGAACGCTPDEAQQLTQRLQRLRGTLRSAKNPPRAGARKTPTSSISVPNRVPTH